MGNKRQKFYYASIVTFFIAGFFLNQSTANTFASSTTDEVTVTIPFSCSLTSTVSEAHSAEIENGVYSDDIGETNINAFCNDTDGFSIYAVGYTNNEFGNNTMAPNTLNGTNAIATGLATSGTTSNWAMKLSSASENFAITNDFNSYHTIPDEYIKVATYPSNTTTTAGANIKSTYASYISMSQPADSYTGKVKYTIVHPANADTPLRMTIDDLTYMQDFKDLPDIDKGAVLFSMQYGKTYSLIDNRDSKTYQIAKLKDGNVWMAENLDLGRTDLTTDLTSTNTNLATTVTATTFNSWRKTTTMDNTNDNGGFLNSTGTDPTSDTNYGTLYNYNAATAGTFVGPSSNQDLHYDICPAGWRLPIGGEVEGEFAALYRKYNSVELMRAPINENGAGFSLAGINGNGHNYVGFYWSSMRHSSGTGVYSLYARDYDAIASFYPNYIMSPSNGLSIRCIVDEKIPGLTYLQDYNALSTNEKIAVRDNMEYNINYTLIDNRDNRAYTVAKLKDGNIWMAENLDLGRTSLTKDLTSENSNLAETVTASTFNSWKNNNTSSSGMFGLFTGVDTTSGTPYGAAYNYHAATGGAFPGDYYSVEGENPNHDICPAGWRLPSHSSIVELYNHYGSFESFRAPIINGGAGFAITGYDLGYLGSYGWYWTGTAYPTYNAYYYYFTSSVNFDGFGGRQHIASVRCIAKKPEFSLTISYDEGISSLTIDGNEVANGTIITSEKDKELMITVTPKTRYAFNGWNTTSGYVKTPANQYTYFVMGENNGTLSATTAYVETEIQNLDYSSCTSAPLSVYDNRDEQVYTVRRAKDGNCWMLNDLTLGKTTLTTDLTSSNTNLSTAIAASTFNSWKSSSIYGSEYNNNGRYVPSEEKNFLNGSDIGTQYNYYSASAGTISGDTNTSNAVYDICPAGWRLPTGNSYGEFEWLEDSYYPNKLLAKSVSEGGLRFNSKDYWSSTKSNNEQMYYAEISYSNVTNYVTYYPIKTRARKSYSYIRCVLDNPTHTFTVSYGTGISKVLINNQEAANGATFTNKQGTQYAISVIPDAQYVINSWSATSGTIKAPNTQYTSYSIGSSDATLSVTVSYVDTEIQNLSSSSCTSTPSTAYDNRDGHVYMIQRLLDGKCWMMENLDLGRTALTTDLTSSNTNLSNTITASTFNGWKKTAGTLTNTAGEFISVDGIDKSNKMPFGTLYNYYATSAGTISGNSNSSNAEYDICPAGWRLPTGGENGEFATLYNYYNSFELIQAPPTENGAAFATAGYIYKNHENPNEKGEYWSSTYRNSSGMFRLWFSRSIYSNDMRFDLSESRTYGCSIRCVLK